MLLFPVASAYSLWSLLRPQAQNLGSSWGFVLFWSGHQPKPNRCGFMKGPDSMAQVRRILRNNLYSIYSYYLKDSDRYFTLGWLTSHYSGFPTQTLILGLTSGNPLLKHNLFTFALLIPMSLHTLVHKYLWNVHGFISTYQSKTRFLMTHKMVLFLIFG